MDLRTPFERDKYSYCNSVLGHDSGQYHSAHKSFVAKTCKNYKTMENKHSKLVGMRNWYVRLKTKKFIALRTIGNPGQVRGACLTSDAIYLQHNLTQSDRIFLRSLSIRNPIKQ